MSFKKIFYFIIINIIIFVLFIKEDSVFGSTIVTPVYSYSYDDVTYNSSISVDHAWDLAMKDQLEDGNITMEDVIENYSVFGSRDVYELENEIQGYSLKPKLSGVVQWQPNENCAYLPLRGVKVELYFHYGSLLPIKVDETYLNNDGSFYFDDYEKWGNIICNILTLNLSDLVSSKFSIRIYPSSETFLVGKDWVASSLVEKLEGLAAGIFPNYFSYFISFHLLLEHGCGMSLEVLEQYKFPMPMIMIQINHFIFRKLFIWDNNLH